MLEIRETTEFLKILGERLRHARVERNDTMKIFADRLGVSEGTVRDMERGARTVQIGTWLNALWMVDCLDDVRSILEPRESLIEKARMLAKRKTRIRAYPRLRG
ncbi:MAG: helix-turn-helix transcriptional regulator [Betaproteobacteria bacterium]|nr:helix-turn-helix transcriptional regulator [Betaproteobacteria bacterium]